MERERDYPNLSQEGIQTQHPLKCKISAHVSKAAVKVCVPLQPSPQTKWLINSKLEISIHLLKKYDSSNKLHYRFLCMFSYYQPGEDIGNKTPFLIICGWNIWCRVKIVGLFKEFFCISILLVDQFTVALSITQLEGFWEISKKNVSNTFIKTWRKKSRQLFQPFDLLEEQCLYDTQSERIQYGY